MKTYSSLLMVIMLFHIVDIQAAEGGWKGIYYESYRDALRPLSNLSLDPKVRDNMARELSQQSFDNAAQILSIITEMDELLKKGGDPVAGREMVRKKPMLLNRTSIIKNALMAVQERVITRECRICLSDVAASGMHGLSCGHEYCDKCLTGVLDEAIKSKEINKLKCPNYTCRRSIARDIEKITQDKAKIAELKKIIPCGTCSKLHPGMTCEEAKKEREKRKNEYKKLGTKYCPECVLPIERSEGCKHMTCKCGHEFCWMCSEPYKGQAYGGHEECEIKFTQEKRDILRKQKEEAIEFWYKQQATREKSGKNPYQDPTLLVDSVKEAKEFFSHEYHTSTTDFNKLVAREYIKKIIERDRRLKYPDIAAYYDARNSTFYDDPWEVTWQKHQNDANFDGIIKRFADEYERRLKQLEKGRQAKDILRKQKEEAIESWYKQQATREKSGKNPYQDQRLLADSVERARELFNDYYHSSTTDFNELVAKGYIREIIRRDQKSRYPNSDVYFDATNSIFGYDAWEVTWQTHQNDTNFDGIIKRFAGEYDRLLKRQGQQPPGGGR